MNLIIPISDDTILLLEYPKNSTKKLLDLKWHTFGKVAGHKTNIQKLVGFLYANNEQAEEEIRKTILLTLTWK
jgi:hypothetical protein